MTAPSLSELSSLLFREREILDRLVAVLADGADRAETDGLLRSVSSLELHRAITAREVAVDLGLDGEPTLSDLVAASPEDWAAVLDVHRRSLLALIDEAARRLRSTGVAAAAATAKAADTFIDLTEARRPGIQRSLTDFLR